MTGLAAGGAQIIIFSTGRGNAIGAPVAPTVKVTGNPNTARTMGENIDVDVSTILTGDEDLDAAGERVWERVVKVASGRPDELRGAQRAAALGQPLRPVGVAGGRALVIG